MVKPGFDGAEFRATLERMTSGTDHGISVTQPSFDPALHRDVTADAVAGRKIDDFKQALEALGFLFWPANKLLPYADGTPHAEGEWRCGGPPRMAFTVTDVLSMFPGGPQELHEWVTDQRLRHRKAFAARLRR